MRDIESYRTEGAVHWWHELPEHPAVHTADGTDADAPLLTIDRIPPVDPPRPDFELRPWLTGRVDGPRQAPGLLDDESHRLGEHPEITDAFATYLGHWEEWARRELRDGPVREVYAALFATYVKASPCFSRPSDAVVTVDTAFAKKAEGLVPMASVEALIADQEERRRPPGSHRQPTRQSFQGPQERSRRTPIGWSSVW